MTGKKKQVNVEAPKMLKRSAKKKRAAASQKRNAAAPAPHDVVVRFLLSLVTTGVSMATRPSSTRISVSDINSVILEQLCLLATSSVTHTLHISTAILKFLQNHSACKSSGKTPAKLFTSWARALASRLDDHVVDVNRDRLSAAVKSAKSSAALFFILRLVIKDADCGIAPLSDMPIHLSTPTGLSDTDGGSQGGAN
jgi:hypothetical protein